MIVIIYCNSVFGSMIVKMNAFNEILSFSQLLISEGVIYKLLTIHVQVSVFTDEHMILNLYSVFCNHVIAQCF